jgi:hypothetical protein
VDDLRFDALTKALDDLASRRKALRAAGIGGLAATLAAVGWHDANAKKKRRKRKKKNKKRCKKFVERCSSDSACCSGQCCRFVDPVDQLCIRSRDVEVCCLDGLGTCESEFPNCCADEIVPGGSCCLEGFPVCCYDELGDEAWCCPADSQCCLLDEDCAEEEVCGGDGCCQDAPLREAAGRNGGQGRTAAQPRRTHR